jgi:hypothetical protein
MSDDGKGGGLVSRWWCCVKTPTEPQVCTLVSSNHRLALKVNLNWGFFSAMGIFGRCRWVPAGSQRLEQPRYDRRLVFPKPAIGSTGN